MLTKLLKYEFKATARYFLPMIAALLAISVVIRICFTLDSGNTMNLSIPTIISLLLYFGILVAIAVLALVITIKRFHSSLLTDEGYLMMTLPVSVDTHIFAKIISSGVWIIASTLASLVSVLIMVLEGDMLSQFSLTLTDLEQAMLEQIGGHLWVLTILCIIIGLANLISALTTIYMCVAIGHQMPKHQVLTAVGAYLAFTVLLQIIIVVSGNFADFAGIFDWFYNLTAVGAAYTVTLGLLAGQLILLAATYLVTRTLLKNHLNLE